ncbi:hypothetical protein SAE02_40650 [Skermanella aerolata]|uniref:Uncharacterized protein n=1 Tax=Skermanella aerolata TaxID=393310 RepID=A0A512DTZ8_9PROT|nr:hypothetical protein [Skermanella aerolata]KJB92021.1 hypothetical protein N826_24610 [Skermanella aerolata KACC 11604]GEO39917.1 hypothetical protein SAE02_40650 [Skermanella aerolata]
MATRNWSRFPKTYVLASRLNDGKKAASLQELEDEIGRVLEGGLVGMDTESHSYRDILGLLEIVVHRDMPARARDPQSETGIYKLFEERTRLKDIMKAFDEANQRDKLEVNGKAVIAVEKFYIDYLWLENLVRSGLPLSDDLFGKDDPDLPNRVLRDALTNASQHFTVAYYFLAQKDKLKRPKDPGLAPQNALKALLVSPPGYEMPLSQEELVEKIVKRTEDEPTRSSLSHDYTRPFRHIPFSAYPSAASKVLGDVINDPRIAFDTWSAAHGAWVYQDQIKQSAQAVIGRMGSADRRSSSEA